MNRLTKGRHFKVNLKQSRFHGMTLKCLGINYISNPSLKAGLTTRVKLCIKGTRYENNRKSEDNDFITLQLADLE